MKRRILLLLITAWIIGSVQVTPTFAFPVDPLPEDNLVKNPWFRSYTNPSDSSLDGWTDEAGLNKYWSSSQKKSNPTSDTIISGVCGKKELYCGTAARLSPQPGQSGGLAEPEVDSYLVQIVRADKTNRKLKFSIHWVHHRVEIAEVTLYGGNAAKGPWTSVWTPFSFNWLSAPPRPTGNRDDEWKKTGLIETTIAQGYDHYKIEIHARLPEPRARVGDIGLKVTGVYFATEFTTDTEQYVQEQVTTPTSTSTPPSQVQAEPKNTQDHDPTLTPTTRTRKSYSPTPLKVVGEIPTLLPTTSSVISPTLQPTSKPDPDGVMTADGKSSRNPGDNLSRFAFPGLFTIGLLSAIILVVLFRTHQK